MSTLKVNTIKPQSGTTVAVSGTLEVSGTINAYEFNTITTNAHSGSNVFGNSSGDTHQFTGSIFLSELQLMASGKELQFADDGEHISGDGSTLSIVSEAGSIAIGAALADGQTLKLGKNGAVETIIAPHGTAGNESYSVINTAGDTDGTDAAGAILLSAVAGGIGLAWADGKDLWAEGGRAVITANEDAADCIKLHADAGTSQTITIVNDAGTDAAAIGLTATAGGITFSADTATFASANSTDPLVVIKNTTNDANGARLRFVKDKGSAGADGDDIGIIEFVGDDAAQTQTTFAKIVAEVSEADDTDEAGKLTFYVAESDGTTTALAAGLILEGEHATDGEVDVTIAAGAASTTTVSGDLTVTSATTFTRPSVTNLADDESIPITATMVNVDANGSARTGIRFAGTGTAGQILIVNNTGEEDLTLHNTEGTCLVRGISADADTIESEGVYVFISDGEFWNYIGGGADSAGDGLGEG
tara:strand:- start:33 stop:1460 length:1428 start_codon:yes stop_codon:yes gene_type:complete